MLPVRAAVAATGPGLGAFTKSWNGRTCYAIAGTRSGLVLAATNSRGVLWLDPSAAAPAWVTPPLDSGLPLRQGGPDEAIPGRILRSIPTLAVDATTRIRHSIGSSSARSAASTAAAIRRGRTRR